MKFYLPIYLSALCMYAAGSAGVFGVCASHTGGSQTGTASEANGLLPPFNSGDYWTGNWGGFREKLSESGIELNASYTTEPAWNPVGGRKQSATYLHNFGLTALFDLEELVGIPHTTLYVSGSQRSGKSLTEEAIGNAISVQQIFGGGQTYRLVELRMQHNLLQDQLEFAYGRLATTSDFMTSPFYCQFVTNAICGQPTAPFFNMPDGLSAYPAATWGALAKFQSTTKETYLMSGVYNGGPLGEAGGDEHGTDFDFGDNGVLLIGEIGYKPEEGLFQLPARYSIGGFYHTGNFPNVAVDANGENLFVTGGTAREMSNQEGYYMILEQMFYRESPDAHRGLNGFLTVTVSPDQAKSTMPYFFNTGFIYEGLFPGRPADKAAAGMYTAWFSRDLRSAQRDAGVPAQSAETGFEINYQVQFTPYFYVRPNIQYIVEPNGLSEIDNALVLGFELGMTF